MLDLSQIYMKNRIAFQSKVDHPRMRAFSCTRGQFGRVTKTTIMPFDLPYPKPP